MVSDTPDGGDIVTMDDQNTERPSTERRADEHRDGTDPSVPYARTPGDASTEHPPTTAAAPTHAAWPTPPAAPTRPRRKTLAIVSIAVGSLVLLCGAFGGGVAVGTVIDGADTGRFSERVMPDGGPGDGQLPQAPDQDGGSGPEGDGGSSDDTGSSGDTGSTDGSSS
jgi:hypothetical protein